MVEIYIILSLVIGIAIGFFLANQKNIREVTLFPLNQHAEDLLMEAPSDATEKKLKELNIKTIKKS